MNAHPPPQQKKAFQRKLLQWYRQNKRPLPWRTRPTLYKTVLSEFMLQQTQVKTVLPYFERWLERFPDFKSLAKAPESAVLKQWEGLGYYSRARNLHALAKTVVTLRPIPTEPADWLRFPGVGPYSAAAICSIAFNYPTAVVDGNLVRILTRLTANNTHFSSNGTAVVALRPLAQSLLDTASPGDHNQAMMELGAVVCSRQNPACDRCPVRRDCAAFKTNSQGSFPHIERKPTVSVKKERLFIVRNKRILLEQTPRKARQLSELYELPLKESISAAVCGELLMVGKRSITHHRIEERIYAGTVKTTPGRLKMNKNLQWVPVKNVGGITLSGPHRKWVDKLLAESTADA